MNSFEIEQFDLIVLFVFLDGVNSEVQIKQKIQSYNEVIIEFVYLVPFS